MIAAARDAKKERVFALTIEPRVAAFFRSLGFEEVERRALPQQWQAHYDFSRPSRAFQLRLKITPPQALRECSPR
jgi:N-acetylglutamate synthase-like GNAT family acetyltransferase